MSVTLLYYTLECEINAVSGAVQYVYYTDGTAEWRKGTRVNKFVWDKAITPLGFGVGSIENVDWVEVNYREKP